MNNIVTIKILDEINVAVIGLTQSQLKYFYDKFGIFANNYFFNPHYKLGRWDGKDRFFSKSGLTSINLLDQILPDLKEMDLTIKLIDKRTNSPCAISIIEQDYLKDYEIDLGEHQVQAINAITTNSGGIVVAGTGAGKSIIAASLIKLYQAECNYNTLIIVPTKDLIHQMSEDLSVFDLDIGKYFSDLKELDHKHVVSTWQSLQNNPTIIQRFKCIIVDECHGAKGNVLKSLIANHGKYAAVRIGLTGTLPKDDSGSMSVRYVLGSQVSETKASVLIDSGWLAKLKLRLYELIEDFSQYWESEVLADPSLPSRMTYKKFKTEYFPDYEAEKLYLQKSKSRLHYIVNMINAATDLHGNSFILVNGVNFGKKLANTLENAYFVYGKDETDVRKQIFKLFAEHNDVKVVSTFKLASTGLNIKRIFNLFLIDSGKSFITIIQSIGRGLRKAHDKDTVHVYDIGSDLKYSKKHLSKRKKYYTDQKYAYIHKKINYSNLDNM